MAGGLGKGPAMVAVLVLPEQPESSPGHWSAASAVDGESAGNFPMCQPIGWQSWTCCCPVLVASGCRGVCKALWTRASLDAARALLSTVSKSVEGKIATAGGRGECRKRESSSVGTVDLTSARSESRRERSRLASAGTAWLPMKARAFDPDERILSKLACAEG